MAGEDEVDDEGDGGEGGHDEEVGGVTAPVLDLVSINHVKITLMVNLFIFYLC